jgi:folate-binding protein YgfZ
MDTLPLENQVAALHDGRAYVEHTDVTLTLVSGADARSWLHDLITTDVASLQPLRSRASLLLSPTGRIRATFHVLGRERDFLLAQPEDQPAPIGGLLAPYVLSSAVELGTSSLRVFSAPGARATLPWISQGWRPGIHGDGVDLLVDDAPQDLLAARQRFEDAGLIPAWQDAVDALRIRRGIPRFPVDLDEESLPAEADLEPTIDLTKGCFLGQESVAKVRNLGHPPRVVLALRSEDPISPGEPVLSGDDVVGVVTSATTSLDGWALLARVRWAARGSDLRTGTGAALRPA